MEINLQLTGGLIFSGALLLALTRKDVLREEAYEWVQRNAMRVWDQGADFQELILEDPDIGTHLNADEVKTIFNIQDRLRHVDAIFERVFGSS